MSERKLDIFAALAAMDRGDGAWLDRQPAEARREFAAPTFLRWASAVPDGPAAEATLLAVNAWVNPHLWEVAAEHPELVFRLAALCGSGRRQRHLWIGAPDRAAPTCPARDLLARVHPDADEAEIDLLLRLHTRDTFRSLADESGLAPPAAKEALQAHERRNAAVRSQGPRKPNRDSAGTARPAANAARFGEQGDVRGGVHAPDPAGREG